MALGRTARRLLWMGALGCALVLFAVGARDDGRPPSDSERVETLAHQFACPECAGQSVAASDAPAARNIRSAIASLVDEGKTEAEIRSLIVDRFGEQVQLTPAATGVVSVVWILPVVVLVVALGALVGVFRRWRPGPRDARTSEQDRVLVDRFLAERTALSSDGR